MRRFILSATAALVLAAGTARPAAAGDVVKQFVDCITFTNLWCEFAREEADNWLEKWAVDFRCSLMPYGCLIEAIL